eukprot:5640543-Pleurochrysis_carterae.AAC.3
MMSIILGSWLQAAVMQPISRWPSESSISADISTSCAAESMTLDQIYSYDAVGLGSGELSAPRGTRSVSLWINLDSLSSSPQPNRQDALATWAMIALAQGIFVYDVLSSAIKLACISLQDLHCMGVRSVCVVCDLFRIRRPASI